jgi:hypothetical protein
VGILQRKAAHLVSQRLAVIDSWLLPGEQLLTVGDSYRWPGVVAIVGDRPLAECWTSLTSHRIISLTIKGDRLVLGIPLESVIETKLGSPILVNFEGPDGRTIGATYKMVPASSAATFHACLVGQVRMLCLRNPGSGEAFYRQASEPAISGEPPLPVDFARIAEAAKQTGAIEILGPPF